MTNLTELPSSTDPPPTLEGIEVEHRLWILIIVNLVRDLWWNARITTKELFNGSEETKPEDPD